MRNQRTRIGTIALLLASGLATWLVVWQVDGIFAESPDGESLPSTTTLVPGPISGVSGAGVNGAQASGPPLNCSGTSSSPFLTTIVIFVYKVGATGRTQCDGLPEQIGVASTLSRGLAGSSSSSAEESNEYEVEVTVSMPCSAGLWPYQIVSSHWAQDGGRNYSGRTAKSNSVSCLFRSGAEDDTRSGASSEQPR